MARYLILSLACLFAGSATAVQAALPAAPYTIRCYQTGDLIVIEQLEREPTKSGVQWRGQIWTGDPAQAGRSIVIDQGADTSCVVTENVPKS